MGDQFLLPEELRDQSIVRKHVLVHGAPQSHYSSFCIWAAAVLRAAAGYSSSGRTGGAGSAAGGGRRAAAVVGAVLWAAVDSRRRKVQVRTSGAKTRKTRKILY